MPFSVNTASPSPLRLDIHSTHGDPVHALTPTYEPVTQPHSPTGPVIARSIVSNSPTSLDSTPSLCTLDSGADLRPLAGVQLGDVESENRGPVREPTAPKVYDEQGRTALPTPVENMIGRSKTLRRISNIIRNASSRVVNAGTRSDEDDKSTGPQPLGIITTEGGEYRPVYDSPGSSPRHPNPPVTPPALSRAPRPVSQPKSALRGRTLCLFTAQNPIRRAMNRLLEHPWFQPLMFILILATAIILTIQSSKSLMEPRPPGRYFQTWEDYALFGVFIVFTIEMCARILVTGLILDPEMSVAQFCSRLWNWANRYLFPERSVEKELKRTAPQQEPSPWYLYKSPPPQPGSAEAAAASKAQRQGTIIDEAPFQDAVKRQQRLLKEGRPYLRHSWQRIDMMATLAFWVEFALAMTGKENQGVNPGDKHYYFFRAVSVLRVARLVVVTSGTATILHSLKKAGPLLLNVSWFIIFAAAMFSIIGVQSFRGSFRRVCILTPPYNSSDTQPLEGGLCGGWIDPDTLTAQPYIDINGKLAPISPKGYICPLNQRCVTQDESQQHGNQSYDNIFKSLVQVLIIAGVNTWSGPMYMVMDSDYYGSALFYLVAIVCLNFWLVNLLVAVIVNTFQDIRTETKSSAFGAETSMMVEPQWAINTKKRWEPSKALQLYEKYAEYFWSALVVVDLISQGFKSSKSSDRLLELLKNMEIAFAFVWDIEIIVRFLFYTPNYRVFFTRTRNDFDLFLAVMCSIIQIPPIRDASVYPWLTIFQLIRWYRVILIFPRMRPLITAVFGSFAGMTNMVLFLFLMNFMSALMGVQLLRGDMGAQSQDPSAMINFAQIYNAWVGMYQVFSTENWTTILYDAMTAGKAFNQRWLICIFLFVWFMFSNFVILQMFIAVITENFEVAEEQKRKAQIDAFIRKTEPTSAHVSWIERLNPYRLIKAHHKTVKVDSLPPNLLLPLKQNFGANVEARVTEEEDSNLVKKYMKRLFGMEERGEQGIPLMDLDHKGKVQRKPPAKRKSTQLSKSTQVTLVDEDDEDDDERGLTDLLPPLNTGPSEDEHQDALRERRNQQADFIAAHPSFDRSMWIFPQGNKMRTLCQALVPPAYGQRIYGRQEHPVWSLAFKVFMFFIIVASVTLAAVATPLYRKYYFERHGNQKSTWFDLLDVVLISFLVIEALIKIIADGFIFSPNAYLLSIWNFTDMLIMLTQVVNVTTSLAVVGGLSRTTRVFKAFRALRLITLFGFSRDTFDALLISGAARIVEAAVLMILYLIPFAVWGLNIFMGRLSSCNDGNVSGRSACTGEYMNSPIGDMNFLMPRAWANPSFGGSIWAFDNFRQSMLILFEIVSLEGWTSVMQSVMNITGPDLQPGVNTSQWNSIFFILFNLFGAVIILTVFLAIIIENFSIRSGSALLTTEQKQWVDLSKFLRQQRPSLLPRVRPLHGFRAWCYDRATQKLGWWTRGYTVLYFAHIILLMSEDFSNNILDETQSEIVFLVLTVLYAVDLIVRFVGLGFKSFRRNGWNLFDLVVIIGSLVTTILALQATEDTGASSALANKQVQRIFLVLVGLKLVQRLDSLNELFKTSVASLPAVLALFLLWAGFFIFFGLAWLEIFGLTKQGANAQTRFQNYYSFPNTIVMMSFMSTGEGWNGYMHDYTIQFPRCTMGQTWFDSDCGSVGWAYVLFIAWNILSMYIFLNLFTSVMVQSFAYVYQKAGGISLSREEIRSFKKAWAEIDTERTGYIQRKDVVRFLSKLTGIFDVEIYPPEARVPNLLRSAAASLDRSNDNFIIHGHDGVAYDLKRMDASLQQIDFKLVAHRRRQYVRLYYEARMSEDPNGKGIGFTSMLTVLAHYKLIDDEKALQLEELLQRRAKMERVTDLVNLDRVRGLLRTIYLRRRFTKLRDEKRRVLAEEGDGVPAIVVDLMPAAPQPPHQDEARVFTDEPKTISPPGSERGSSIPPSPDLRVSPPGDPVAIASPLELGPRRQSPTPVIDISFSSVGNSVFTHPLPGDVSGLSLAIGAPNSPSTRHNRNVSTASRGSDYSRLSSSDAHRREYSFDELDDSMFDNIASSVWGNMMAEAVDEEENES